MRQARIRDQLMRIMLTIERFAEIASSSFAIN
jgi:hypothetical protein